MPPKPISSSFRAWRCPQCRSFSVSARHRQLGPEHPNYMPIPEAPQQTIPDRPFIKGRLPVPRDVFARAVGSQDKATEPWLEPATKTRKSTVPAKEGSREEWRNRMRDMRRQNLREGLASLRVRKDSVEAKQLARSEKNQREREQALNAPEREDERLTAPSHGLDLEHLAHAHTGGVRVDPSRNERIARAQANLAARAEVKAAERANHLHTLYTNARHFIVDSQQLDTAIDEAFGTEKQPVTFATGENRFERGASVWAYGRPDRVQDLLNRANNVVGRNALDSAGGFSGVNNERVRRIAEAFTGGKMGGGEAVGR